MMAVIAVLLLAWLALSVVGAIYEGLFWLMIVGAGLFVATAAYGAIKRRRNRQPL
jgi:LPXTG-motif cell wall-anchored protein